MGRNLADVEYKMRMTQDLKEKIVESAKEHNRSMNADIVARLEQSFEKTITPEHEVNDLRELLKQSMDSNKEYFSMITELLKKRD